MDSRARQSAASSRRNSNAARSGRDCSPADEPGRRDAHEILGEAFKFGFYWVWGIGLFVAFLTAFSYLELVGKYPGAGGAACCERAACWAVSPAGCPP